MIQRITLSQKETHRRRSVAAEFTGGSIISNGTFCQVVAAATAQQHLQRRLLRIFRSCSVLIVRVGIVELFL